MDSFWLYFNGLDKKIDNCFAPISDAVSNFVFYPITINGVDVPIIIIWLLLGAIIFTIITRGISIWGFKHALDVITGKVKHDDNEEGEVSSFQALATALSGTVGLGNIAGVAVAITMGGPGAVLWMILGAFFGMSSKFMEATLGVKYRRVNADGSVSGGPMHYISHGLTRLKLRWLGQPLAVVFCWMCIAEAFGGGNMFQINMATAQVIEITGGENSFFYHNSWVFGLIMAIVIGSIIIGGIKSIARVAEKIVPFMCILYVVSGLVVIFIHFTQIPEAITTIFNEAFNPKAVEGGIIGSIIWGLRRSVQSNEAGVGSAPIAYATVKTKEPVSQGFVSLLEPFIDTVIVCFITAFVIIITETHLNTDGAVGAELTSRAFESVWPFFPYVLAVVITLFALSTLISWSYYGQKAWSYLFGEGEKRTRTYQIVFCSFIVIGSSMNMMSVIDFTDAMMFAMAVPNLIGVYFLAPQVLKDLKEYCQRHNVGIHKHIITEPEPGESLQS
ncbi:MAG: alanine glycine permease [Candidatus Melainabacteria bacterium GWF2_37_15]|nr:MAG: alanine glycine permease [Candidatus Melainabacteria bacterium GWF2_37_15]